MWGDYQMLAIKSILDGITAIAFASTFGVGVLLSAAMVLVYQGAISLLAGTIGKGFDQSVILEMTSVGGVILAGIAISNLLEIKKDPDWQLSPRAFNRSAGRSPAKHSWYCLVLS